MELRLVHPNHDVEEIGCACCNDEKQARETCRQIVEEFDKCQYNSSTGTRIPAMERLIEELRKMVDEPRRTGSRYTTGLFGVPWSLHASVHKRD